MKTHFTLFASLLFLMLSSSLSAQSFEKGTKILAAGLGLGSSLGSSAYNSQTPGISLQYEQGVWDAGEAGVISLGGYVGFKSFGSDYTSPGFSSSAKWNYTIVGVRSAYHYTGLENERVDLYGGLMLSYNILNYSYESSGGSSTNTGASSNTSGLTLYLGGRYYFASNIAAFAEVGYGISHLNLGLALRF